MKISIVIPAFNEERLLGGTLSSAQAGLSEFSKLGWEGELIVCDNNSTDRTAEIARQAGAKVVFEPVNQIARARNCGAAAASGDWLIFIDADSRPSLELFHAVRRLMESGQCLAGGSTVRLDENHFWANRFITLWNWISRMRTWMAGSFIFCEAQAFRAIGGFSNQLYASEELDLSKRLKLLAAEKGKSIVIIDEFPLITSARKIHLYSFREHMWFLAKTIATWGGTLNRKESCPTWYDGRR